MFVLEREIGVTGLGNAEVRDLTFHPDIGKHLFEEGFNLRGKLRYC
jgi:hypothetical protein